jgi:CO/xanthine dehydrogenase FAD-binding subunit
MKPPPFEYFDPHSIDEALSLLAQHGEDGKVLAGGQSLVPMLNFRLLSPRCLIDINRVESLAGIRRDGDELIIGASTRTRALEFSKDVADTCPLFCEVVPNIAHFQIRNRGTVGGSLSHADPAAELPATMTALGARFVLSNSTSTRTVLAESFFTGYLTTCLEPDELLTQIRVPAQAGDSGFAFLEVSRRHGDFALVGVAVVLVLDDSGRCSSASIVLTGAHDTPFRAVSAASVLEGAIVGNEHVEEAAHRVADGLAPQSDIHASAEYRVDVARVLTRRAVGKALERARAGRLRWSKS